MDDFEYQLAQEALEAGKNQQSDNNNQHEYVDQSGTVYEWDHNRKGWFPKISDDFIAKYQASYGITQDSTSNDKTEGEGKEEEEEEEEEEGEEEEEEGEGKTEGKSHTVVNEESTNTGEAKSDSNNQNVNKRKPPEQSVLNKRKPPEQPTWFEVDDEHNTNVYVSNLPLDTSQDEFVELMKKCGLIMKDEANKFKIKLYKDSSGKLKGDARCCYAKIESVELALNILDGYEFKGNIIKVERAKFSLKGDFDPTKKPKKRKGDKEKMKKKIEKLLDWRPDKLPGERPRCEKVVIIKNMFDIKEFENEPKLILEYKNDLRDECGEKCGEVKKVEIFDCNPEGVAAVTFKEFSHADQCVEIMNGRWFAGRQLIAHHWDGKTKYKIQETEEDIQKRIDQWDKFLEGETN